MQKYKLGLALILSALVTACGSDNNSKAVVETTPNPAMIRVVHASSDAPNVDITANGALFGGLSGVDYQVASGLATIPSTNYTIGVVANTAGGQAEVLTTNFVARPDVQYNILAIGNVADNSLELLRLAVNPAANTEGTTQVQIVHAAPNAPAVDIYVTAPDTNLAAEQPLATAAYKDATELVAVPSGDYQIRITPAGADTLVFDSGTVSLASGENLVVAATTNVGPGDSPVQLVVAGIEAATVVNDVNTPAAIRVIHAVADAPAVDVIANNALTLFDGAPFLGVTDYAEVPGATYLIDVAADADNSIVVIDDAEVSLATGMTYTAIANNTLSNIALDLQADMPRRVATDAQVRIVHASPAAGAVDIYVTADGEIDGVTPAFTNVPFTAGDLAETGYVSLPPGDYVVTVTPTGTMTKALETGVLSLMGNKIYTAIAVDAEGGGSPVGLILADDFVE